MEEQSDIADKAHFVAHLIVDMPRDLRHFLGLDDIRTNTEVEERRSDAIFVVSYLWLGITEHIIDASLGKKFFFIYLRQVMERIKHVVKE